MFHPLFWTLGRSFKFVNSSSSFLRGFLPSLPLPSLLSLSFLFSLPHSLSFFFFSPCDSSPISSDVSQCSCYCLYLVTPGLVSNFLLFSLFHLLFSALFLQLCFLFFYWIFHFHCDAADTPEHLFLFSECSFSESPLLVLRFQYLLLYLWGY